MQKQMLDWSQEYHDNEKQTANGILYLVPTPVGNLGDMTLRGLEVLKSVALIAAEDTRTSLKLLNHYKIKNRLLSYHKFNERRQIQHILNILQSGDDVALISDAGTPGISDPANILVKEAVKNDIRICCLPGATALIPALSASGLDTDCFTFAGFLPARQKERQALLKHLAELPHTIILYESPHRLVSTLQEVFKYFGDRNVVIAREISKIFETYLRKSLSELVNQPELIELKGEFIILLEGYAPREMDDESLAEIINSFPKSNKPLKDLVAQIALETGEAKNRIYRLAISLKKRKETSGGSR